MDEQVRAPSVAKSLFYATKPKAFFDKIDLRLRPRLKGILERIDITIAQFALVIAHILPVSVLFK